MGRIVIERPEGRLSSYDSRSEETLDPQGLRQMYERARWAARTPSVRVPEAARTALADTLRDFLHEYVDPSTDRVGHAFPMGGDCGRAITFERDGLYTNPQFSSVAGLVDALTRGAAVAGCDRVTRLVEGPRFHTVPTPIIVFVKGGQRRRLNQRNQTVHRIGSSPHGRLGAMSQPTQC